MAKAFEFKNLVGTVELVEASELLDFQGTLKDLSPASLERMKASIRKNGFFDPVRAWKDPAGKIWKIDGHQRVRAAVALAEEAGAKGAKIPVVWVKAASLKDAKKMVVAASSQYGHVTKDGFLSFAAGAGLVPGDLADFAELEGFDAAELLAGGASFNTEESDVDLNPEFNHKCPRCKFEFD